MMVHYTVIHNAAAHLSPPRQTPSPWCCADQTMPPQNPQCSRFHGNCTALHPLHESVCGHMMSIYNHILVFVCTRVYTKNGVHKLRLRIHEIWSIIKRGGWGSRLSSRGPGLQSSLVQFTPQRAHDSNILQRSS